MRLWWNGVSRPVTSVLDEPDGLRHTAKIAKLSKRKILYKAFVLRNDKRQKNFDDRKLLTY